MNYSILFFELSIVLSAKEFKTQLDKAGIYSADFINTDTSLISDGIGIKYHDNKKKKIKLVVYPGLVTGGDNITELWKPTSENISILRKELESIIRDYFDSEYDLNDFTLSHVDFAADIPLGNKVPDYMKLIHAIGRIKGFSLIKRSKKNGFFGLNGNTNGVQFRCFGLKHNKSILRIEVRLTKKDVIKDYSGETDTSKQIKAICKNSRDIFMDTFRYIVPYGDHYKLKQAKERVTDGVSDKSLRHKMLRLLELIPKKKSLLLAQKALNARNIIEIMSAFEDIKVSPIPLSKRHSGKKLDSIYYFLD